MASGVESLGKLSGAGAVTISPHMLVDHGHCRPGERKALVCLGPVGEKHNLVSVRGRQRRNLFCLRRMGLRHLLGNGRFS